MGHHGGFLEWQLVCLEEELYKMLCVARKCKGKLDKGDMTIDDGTCESVLLLNVAVFRLHCNSWDIEVSDQGGKSVLHVSWLQGVDDKVLDSAPDFGYTRNAQHAVTWACVEVDTEEEMEDTLSKHPGAWVVKLSPYLICLHTSSPNVEDVKSHQSGLSLVGAGASGIVLADVHKSLSSLTMQKWLKMNDSEKEAIWLLVGLDAAGKNSAGCKQDSLLKEVQPMVCNCSYRDACLVTSQTVWWPYICAEAGCGKYVNLKCCEKFA